jgi:UDP-N-acetylenolpyruvoylglucosamine reductase
MHFGAISLYNNNCAVLVNSGNQATATDVLKVINKVRTIVYWHTGAVIPIEPALVGFTQEELCSTLSLKVINGEKINLDDDNL